MAKLKPFFAFSFLFILLFAHSLSQNPKEIQSQMAKIESLISDELFPWKLKKQEVEKGEKVELDDAAWETLGRRDSIREKVCWLRREFKAPEVFAGMKTAGSRVSLACAFRGVGLVKGSFFLNGELKESFELPFGNQDMEIKKEFPITFKSSPGETFLLAFRLENLGKLPLVERKTAEPGTYLRLQECRFRLEKCEEAKEILSQFLLDLKIGAALLDLEVKKDLPPRLIRPVATEYQKFLSSREFRGLQQKFEKALLEFNPEIIRSGDFSRVRDSLAKFYKNVAAISLFAKSYTLSLAGNSHIDLAWLWRWLETVEVTKETFSTILDNMEEYPDIVYVQSQAQAYRWIEERYPELFERIRKKVKEGRWEIVGGMWAEADCNLIDGESFIRQLLYGKRYFKEKFNVDVKIGWNPDSFGYNWNIPQFLRKSGIEAFITQKLSWNDTNVFPYLIFWWEAPDGSRVLTYFPPTGYVGELEAREMVNGLKQVERNTAEKNALILYGLGDHGGGPNREMLNRAREYEKQKIFPRMKHSTVAQYLSELKKKNLPLWKDELYLEYHRGTYTTQAETKNFNRKSEVLLSQAEKAASLAYLFGAKYPQKNLKQAWENVLLNQFHDILPGSSINPVYRDAREFYLEAQKLGCRSLQENLAHLAKKIDTGAKENGTPFLVFNSLSWERDGVVFLDLPQKLEGPVAIHDDQGVEVPSQKIVSSDEKNVVAFVAKKVPSFGYRVYRIGRGEEKVYSTSLKVGETTLENQYFLIALNPKTGNMVSIFDKLNKKEVLAPSGPGNELQLFEDIPDYWDAWDIKYTGREWKLDEVRSIQAKQKGPVMASLEVKKSFLGLAKSRWAPTTDFPSSFFSQEIILYEGIPRIDVRMKADWWEEHVLLKVAFPVDVHSDNATYEIPYSFIQRSTGQKTDWEKARYEVSAIRWADLSDGNYGVSLINESKYGYDIKDNIMRLTLLRSPLWPDPMADRGKHDFSYCLYPHKGDWKEANTVHRGHEFNHPFSALLVEPHSGELPSAFSFFRVNPDNVILAAMKKAEDRDSLVLRLYESEGTATEATVEVFPGDSGGKLPMLKKAYELDFMENRRRAVSFKNNSIPLKFGKSEIKTLELIFQRH